MNTINVWITRPQSDAHQMVKQIKQHPLVQGITPWILPVLEIVPCCPTEANTQQSLDQTDLVIVTSRHAITGAIQQKLSFPINAQWFAVGKATAEALLPSHIQAIIPEQQDSEGILALTDLANIQGKKIIILKGIGGRPVLAQQLTQRGAIITELSLYQRQCCSISELQITSYLHSKGQHIITIPSGETLDCLIQSLSAKHKQQIISQTTLAVMSERIAQHAKTLGWTTNQIAIAPTTSLDGLIQAISILSNK